MSLKCPNPVRSQCHCALCHQTFGTLTDFDRHHVRDFGAVPPVTCLPPGPLGLVQDERGVWRTPEGLSRHDRVRSAPGHGQAGSIPRAAEKPAGPPPCALPGPGPENPPAAATAAGTGLPGLGLWRRLRHA